VKATNRDEALERVKDGYKHEVHVLDSEDFKAVHFKVATQERSR
jgi:hypothetical protein